ncbi:Ankyrin repeat protein [Pandoravirus kuranda]|uniref:Ankyrin repeat protein n=1 Tax=Pandoravirus kuranda TaxID=3019033 RepID=A0AA95EET0_9VIRU|nr:Ankyrin repeat protein [Pandoravirus kuranda]
MDNRESWGSFRFVSPSWWGSLHRRALPIDRDFRQRWCVDVVRRPAVGRRSSARSSGNSSVPGGRARSFDDDDDDTHPLSLSALPREILDVITASIDRIRDPGARSIATGLPTKGHHARAILRHGVDLYSVLSAGAPFDVVRDITTAQPLGQLSDIVISAAVGGRAKVFDYIMKRWLSALDRGFMLGDDINAGVASMDDTVADALVTAASLGHARIIDTIAYNYDALDWALPRGACSEAVAMAIERSHWASLVSLSIACPADCIRSLIPWAILRDAPQAIKIVLPNMTPREKDTLFQCAVETGAWRVARWLASAGRKVVDLRDKDLPQPLQKPPLLEWLRAQGCPWGSDTCKDAARGGHLRVLQWAVTNGCTWEADACRRIAAGSNHGHVTAWIDAHTASIASCDTLQPDV